MILKTLVLAAILAFGSSAPAATRVTPADFSGAKQPRIAIVSNGALAIAFGRGDTVYFTRSDDAGQSFTPPLKVGELPKLALGMRRGPRIAAGKNTLTISAISHDEGNLSVWTSSDGGKSWSDPHVLNSVPRSAAEGLHTLAGDGGEKLFISWLDMRNQRTELWGATSADGGKSWGPNMLVYRSPEKSICECCHPSAIFTPDGAIIAMWRNSLDGKRDIYRSISRDGGQTFEAAEKIGETSWQLKACPMDGGDLSAGPTGVTYVWRREHRLFYSEVSGRETLLAPRGTHPAVVTAGSGPVFFWQDAGSIYTRSNNQPKARLLARNSGFVSAARRPGSPSVNVVWEADDGIYSTIID